jgi:DegV family protein with EDD domain
MSDLYHAFSSGYECLAAWAELIDRINVFPVADGDTGSNLRLSLAPLLNLADGREAAVDQLGRSAIGNSGNIAAAFFREFVRAGGAVDLPVHAARGRNMAWQAVADPRSGTMLSVFETLAHSLEQDNREVYSHLCEQLHQTVLEGVGMLPELARAGVVDAGALAMYVFFDGFFRRLSGEDEIFIPVLTLFAGNLRVNSEFQVEDRDSYCVDAVIDPGGSPAAALEKLSGLGESLVMVPDSSCLKVHVHTPDPEQLHARLSSLGEVTSWSDEVIDENGTAQLAEFRQDRAVHLVSDAAGSLPRELARQNSITLLDSYVVAEGRPRPESLCRPADMYALLRTGSEVKTAQASTFERYQHYESICRQCGKTLYLCVGSAFTGNFATAMAWKKENDPDDLLTVLDTGAASGRLGLIALLTARYAEQCDREEDIIRFARQRIDDCIEYVFIDELKYLAAGGRVSRANGFFGDLLRMKPVVSPTREGVKKMGVVHSRKGQLDFALKKLSERFRRTGSPVLMLQYSDNKEWVEDMVQEKIQELVPAAEILLVPLSLTSGVHMGPGTWSLAFAPLF